MSRVVFRPWQEPQTFHVASEYLDAGDTQKASGDRSGAGGRTAGGSTDGGRGPVCMIHVDVHAYVYVCVWE